MPIDKYDWKESIGKVLIALLVALAVLHYLLFFRTWMTVIYEKEPLPTAWGYLNHDGKTVICPSSKARTNSGRDWRR